MTSIERIERELNDAKARLDEATKDLEEWKKEWKKKLDELEEKLDNKEWGDDVEQKERWEGRIKRLIEEKERLEATKERWEKQVEEWGKALRDFNKGEVDDLNEEKPGNKELYKDSDLNRAFQIDFKDHVNYMSFLKNRLSKVSNSLENYYNYLPVVQSSGYGKTRSICELAKSHPLIYICFRDKGSTGYPPATPKSDIMLKEIKEATNIESAEEMAKIWLKSMIFVFYEMKLESSKLLTNTELENNFWEKVHSTKEILKSNWDAQKIDNKITKKIAIFFDESSALLDIKINQAYKNNQDNDNKPFRAIRRALYFFSEYAYGIHTDTNSSVVNLAPSKDKDSSARKCDRNIHKPFIYIVTQDCLSDIDQIPHDEDISAHDIIQFGRPLWASNWVASKHSDNQFKFRDVINLAKAKLLGSTSSWDICKFNSQWKRTVTLALIACTAALYVSPASSIAPELVRAHMATLIAIDKDYENYIITYPSEPILSEASLELISEGNIWKEVLQELDYTFRSGGILDAGTQGELAVRLLLLNAWHHLVLSKKSINSKVAFSSRFPVIDFLQELLGDAFPKEKFSHFNDFMLGFTHFIPVTYVPVKEDLISIYKRRGAVLCKRNQKGIDLIIPIMCNKNIKIGTILIQIKNHAHRDSKIKYELGSPLSPNVTFEDSLANELKDNNLGLLLHVGSAYINKSSLETYCYDEEHKQFNNPSSYDLRSKSNSIYDLSKHNRLVACGLDSFNITTEYKIIFQSLLHSWTDPIRFAKEEDNVEQFLHQMMPCTYSRKRFCDDDEEKSYKKSKQE